MESIGPHIPLFCELICTAAGRGSGLELMSSTDLSQSPVALLCSLRLSPPLRPSPSIRNGAQTLCADGGATRAVECPFILQASSNQETRILSLLPAVYLSHTSSLTSSPHCPHLLASLSLPPSSPLPSLPPNPPSPSSPFPSI